MKVYVVNKMCDDEYFCTEVVFITRKEEIAKEYCDKYNEKSKCWDDVVRDTITYQEYELATELPEEV